MTIQDVLIATGSSGWGITPRLLDLVYDPIDPGAVASAWVQAVASLPAPLRANVQYAPGMWQTQPLYVDGVFNCNKMDRWFAAFVDMELAAAAAQAGTPKNGPAFGVLSYLIGGQVGQGHDINWYIDSASKLHYYEKQTGDEVTLSAVEVASIFFAEIA